LEKRYKKRSVFQNAASASFIKRKVGINNTCRVGREAMQPTAECSFSAPGSLRGDVEIGLEGLDSPTRLHFLLSQYQLKLRRKKKTVVLL